MSDVPVIGAALPVEGIAEYRDWLFEADRDLEIQTFHWPDVLDGDWRPQAEEAKRLLDGFGGRVGIHGPFWGFTINSIDPLIREVVTKRLMQGLDVAEAVGANQMVIHSPYGHWDYNNFDNIAGSRERVLELIHATLDPVVKRAEDQGVTMVMENIGDKDPSARRRVIEEFNSPALRLSIDTGHAQYAHGSTGAPPVDYYVVDAGNLLEHVHLQDADGYADRHWSIGEGLVRWHAVFRALATLTSRPRLVLELRDRTRIPASMAFLERECLGR